MSHELSLKADRILLKSFLCAITFPVNKKTALLTD